MHDVTLAHTFSHLLCSRDLTVLIDIYHIYNIMLQRRVAFSGSVSRKTIQSRVPRPSRPLRFSIRAELKQEDKSKTPDAPPPPKKGGSDPKLDFVLAVSGMFMCVSLHVPLAIRSHEPCVT